MLVKNCFIFFSIIFISCTRDLSQQANLKLKLSSTNKISKNNVLQFLEPERLIVQFRYDGKIETFNWSSNSNCSDEESCEFPSEINFAGKTFPAGNARIFQVLLVYKDENDALQFYYADRINFSTTAGENEILISDEDWIDFGLAGAQNIVSGKIQDTSGRALNGDVGVFIQPLDQNGVVDYSKPKMEVIQTAVFDGWFKFMFFENIALTYKTKSGIDLFVDKKMADFDVTSDQMHAVQILVPEHWKIDSFLYEEMPQSYSNISVDSNDLGSAYPKMWDGFNLLQDLNGLFDNDSATGIFVPSTVTNALNAKVDFDFTEPAHFFAYRFNLKSNGLSLGLAPLTIRLDAGSYDTDWIDYNDGFQDNSGVLTVASAPTHLVGIDLPIPGVSSYLVHDLRFIFKAYESEFFPKTYHTIGYFSNANKGGIATESATISASASRIFYPNAGNNSDKIIAGIEDDPISCEYVGNPTAYCYWPNFSTDRSTSRLNWSTVGSVSTIGRVNSSVPQASDSICLSTYDFISSRCIQIHKANLDKEVIGIHGPYQTLFTGRSADNLNDLAFDYSSVFVIRADGTRQVNWKYLPNMASAISGTALFALQDPYGDDLDDENIPCSALAKQASLGFWPDGNENKKTLPLKFKNIVGISSAKNQSAEFPPILSNDGDMHLVLCPYRLIDSKMKFFATNHVVKNFMKPSGVVDKVFDLQVHRIDGGSSFADSYTILQTEPLSEYSLYKQKVFLPNISTVTAYGDGSFNNPHILKLGGVSSKYLNFKLNPELVTKNNVDFATGFSFRTWFKFNSSVNNVQILHPKNDIGPFQVYISGTNLHIKLNDQDQVSFFDSSINLGGSNAPSTYQNLLLTYNPEVGSLKIYLNSVLLNTIPINMLSRRLGALTSSYYIGKNNISLSGNLDLASMQIWNRPLSDAEITVLNGIKPPGIP